MPDMMNGNTVYPFFRDVVLPVCRCLHVVVLVAMLFVKGQNLGFEKILLLILIINVFPVWKSM